MEKAKYQGNYKELNSSKELNELGSGFFSRASREKCSPHDALILEL